MSAFPSHPHSRGHRRHSQGQGQKHLCARPYRAHVRSKCAKARKTHSERFRGKDPSILNNALRRFTRATRIRLATLLETFKLKDSESKGGHQVVMNGNEALGYGLIAAGVRFGAGYPITPWSDIMELLRRELPKYGGSFIQCEDEIASISMAIGASYAGRVAVTGSSGPGISLKTEALGLGGSWRKCRWSSWMFSAAGHQPECRPTSSNPT